MKNFLTAIRVLAEPTRLRMLRLLGEEELSVAEMQDIFSMGQSRVSAHLAQMKREGLVEDRRAGKKIYYAARRPLPPVVCSLLAEAQEQIAEVAVDDVALGLALKRRKDRAAEYFDHLAGKFGRTYIPGRTWRGLCHALLELLPPMNIADLGAGEGTLSQLLARRARRVVAVDNSSAMVEYGARLAHENGLYNVEFRLGDIEDLPLADEEVELVFISQALHHVASPARALREAWRILQPGGRVLILDLAAHQFEEAREMYAHVWLGFAEVEMHQLLSKAGFVDAEVRVVASEAQSPHFRTLLATARKDATI